MLIKIDSCAHRDEIPHEEHINLLVPGVMRLDEDAARIIYDEQMESGKEHVEMIVSCDSLTVNRTGEFSSQMIFRMGCRSEGEYRTPFGMLILGVYCTRLFYDLNENGGEVELSYQLDMNNHFTAIHDISIQISL